MHEYLELHIHKCKSGTEIGNIHFRPMQASHVDELGKFLDMAFVE